MKIEDYSNNIVNSDIIEIYELTSRILNDYYMTFRKNNETYIPIEEIVEWLGLKIIVKDINRYELSPNPNPLIASLNRKEKVIYISSDIGLSYAEKRFALARMLGYFLLSKDIYNYFRQFSLNISSDDYGAEIFASFILVPPIDLLKFMNNYNKNNSRMRFDYEKYMDEASGFFKVPFVYIFATFERIRMLSIIINSENNLVEDNKLFELKRELKNNTPTFLS